MQNYPALTAINAAAASTSVKGTLDSTVGDTFRIEFFANAFADTQCFGQGQTFLGAVTVKDGDQNDTDPLPARIGFNFTALADLRGQFITMTATDAVTGSTSEFSLAYPVTSFVVSDPQGLNGLPGGLVQAMYCANVVPNIDRNGDNVADPDTISFNIPGSGVHTITPFTGLPTISDPVTIDGYTQPGASPNTDASGLSSNAKLLINLSGTDAAFGISGLTISTSDSTVKGLVIDNFTGPGISITDGGQRNHIEGNIIGTDAAGATAAGNRGGVLIDSGSGNTVGGLAVGASNVIAFNTGNGVSVVASSGSASSANAVLSNVIYSNGGLGIDIGNNGRTNNDADDSDTGPNNLQSFPEIAYATREAGKLKVIYSVPSAPANSTYPIRVEFFLADANGQGKTYLGFDAFTEADFNAGTRTVTFVAAAPIKVFDKIVATATDSLADQITPANTSEFSAQATIVSPWQNRGRLRWDVNDDTFVAADDVVEVINYINSKGSGLVPDNAKNQKPYVDVDGDNNVVAMDVIDVINYINAGRQPGGEGESMSRPSSPTSPADDLSTVLALIAADLAAQAARKRRG